MAELIFERYGGALLQGQFVLTARGEHEGRGSAARPSTSSKVRCTRGPRGTWPSRDRAPLRQ